MPSLAEVARSFRTHVAKLEESSRTESSKARDTRNAMGMEIVAELARTERAEYSAWIVQLSYDL